MKMKFIVFATLVFCIGCTPKKTNMNGSALLNGLLIDTTTTEWIADTTNLDFVVDTTLRREYSEESEDSLSIDTMNQEISSAEMAFKVAKPLLICAYGKENILSQKPFHIHLVDGIWIISGTLPKAKNGGVLGGTAYMEIKKANGQILKVIHGE